MSINLRYVEGTIEKLRNILRSHKIISTFYTENTLRRLPCKPEDRVATENKINLVYKIDYSNCEAIYFGESKRSLKSRSDVHKRSVGIAIVIRMKLQKSTGNQITTLAGIRRK